MWMAAPPPVATTSGAVSQVSALAYVNDFSGYVNYCNSNAQVDQYADRELIEVSCEMLGSPQSDQASQPNQTPQSDQVSQSEQAKNSDPSSSAQRSYAWRRLRYSWYLLALAALVAVVVGVVL
jgi:hypothetical protein